jgi:hypothetical protein
MWTESRVLRGTTHATDLTSSFATTKERGLSSSTWQCPLRMGPKRSMKPGRKRYASIIPWRRIYEGPATWWRSLRSSLVPWARGMRGMSEP